MNCRCVNVKLFVFLIRHFPFCNWTQSDYGDCIPLLRFQNNFIKLRLCCHFNHTLYTYIYIAPFIALMSVVVWFSICVTCFSYARSLSLSISLVVCPCLDCNIAVCLMRVQNMSRIIGANENHSLKEKGCHQQQFFLF